MSEFLKSKRPKQGALAVHNLPSFEGDVLFDPATDRFAERVNRMIRGRHSVWMDQIEAAESVADLPHSDLARLVAKEGAAVHNQLEFFITPPLLRRALGVLALDKLIGKLFPPEVMLMDARAYGAENVGIVAEMAKMDDAPYDYRLHAYEEAVGPHFSGQTPAEESKTWYRSRSGDLWVRRVLPAQPTDLLVTEMMEMGMGADYASMQTLFPYLPVEALK